jgi:imidazolonepropionase-like amidohydrolase
MAKLAIRHATVIDATGADPVPDATVLVGDDGRIEAVGRDASVTVPDGVEVVDASGCHVIPGLTDANVHLVASRTPDTLLDFQGRYHELALEAAELTLKYGLTTVFDTWGPAGPLTTARDAINTGAATGSRIFCAGNIIGLGGPLSADFMDPGTVLQRDTVARINEIWEEGTGPRLASMTVQEVAARVDEYIERTGVDFVKYAATDHRAEMYFLLFSENAQQAIVDTAHRHGKTVQAHTTTVESLRIEVALGADVLQHGDLTIEQPIPDALLDEIVAKKLPTASLVVTDRHLAWSNEHNTGAMKSGRQMADINQRALIARGARLLLTTDGFAYGPRIKEHPGFRAGTLSDDVPDLPVQLGRSHLSWIKGAHGGPALGDRLHRRGLRRRRPDRHPGGRQVGRPAGARREPAGRP